MGCLRCTKGWDGFKGPKKSPYIQPKVSLLGLGLLKVLLHICGCFILLMFVSMNYLSMYIYNKNIICIYNIPKKLYKKKRSK